MLTTVLTYFLATCGAVYALASIALWLGALRRGPSQPPDALPFVSVIVPARDEVENITATLTALAQQDYPRDRWEIRVVDDRSVDGTGDLVRSLIPMLPVVTHVHRIDHVPESISPKKNALTNVIPLAAGDVIMTTDADCRPEPRWISSMIAALGERDLVAGYSPFGRRGRLHGKLLALETLSQAFLAMAGIGLGRPITCAGRSFAYRKDVFERLGGFGEKAMRTLTGDDNFFLIRAVSRGFRAAYCTAPASFVWTDPPDTWRRFVNQRTRVLSGSQHLTVDVLLLGGVAWLWLAVMLIGMVALMPAAWIAFAVKFALDSLSVGIAATRLREWRLMAVYPLAALFYLPYFLVFAVLGTFGSYDWKGRQGS